MGISSVLFSSFFFPFLMVKMDPVFKIPSFSFFFLSLFLFFRTEEVSPAQFSEDETKCPPNLPLFFFFYVETPPLLLSVALSSHLRRSTLSVFSSRLPSLPPLVIALFSLHLRSFADIMAAIFY